MIVIFSKTSYGKVYKMPSLLCEYLKDTLRERTEKVYLLEAKVERLQHEIIKQKVRNHCLSDEPENLNKALARVTEDQQQTVKRLRELRVNSRRLRRKFDFVDKKVDNFRESVKQMRKPKKFLLEYNSLDEVEAVRKAEAKEIDRLIADVRRKNNIIYENLKGLSDVYINKYFSKTTKEKEI